MSNRNTDPAKKSDSAIELFPSQWAWKKILGPTFDTLGNDLESVYEKGRNKIIEVAKRKAGKKAETDNKIANLRVARDVIINGAFSEEAISAEYFGGVLAQSRSEKGKDDRGMFYLGIINTLSASQLLLHYLLYSKLNELLLENSELSKLNPADSDDMISWSLFTPSVELTALGIDLDLDITALYNKGLIGDYTYKDETVEEMQVKLHTVKIKPTTLGIQLYVVACGSLDIWRAFGTTLINNFRIDEDLKNASFTVGGLLTPPGK